MPSDYMTIKQFDDFKDEMREFKDAVFKSYDTQKEDYQRYVGVLAEDLGDKIKILAEALKMQIEKSEREWIEHQKEHSILNFKLVKLESLTL